MKILLIVSAIACLSTCCAYGSQAVNYLSDITDTKKHKHEEYGDERRKK